MVLILRAKYDQDRILSIIQSTCTMKILKVVQ